MKFLVDKYRDISIWLSLLIITLGFILASDVRLRAAGVPLIFALGALLFALGSLYERSRNRVLAWIAELILSVCMLAAAAAAVLQLGGFL